MCTRCMSLVFVGCRTHEHSCACAHKRLVLTLCSGFPQSRCVRSASVLFSFCSPSFLPMYMPAGMTRLMGAGAAAGAVAGITPGGAVVGGAIDGPRPGGNRPMRAVRTGPPVRTRRMRPRKPLMKKQLNKQPLKPPEEQVIQQHQDGLHSLRRMGAAGFPEVNGNSSGRTTPPCRCRAASSPI